MTDAEFNRRLLRTITSVTATAIFIAICWAAHNALILIYVSALIAMGCSPLVRLIEQPDDARHGLPRVLAILSIYLAVIGFIVVIGLLVVPPLVDQANALWQRMPDHFTAVQRILVRYKLMTRVITFQEAVRQAPAGSGENAVSTVFTAVSRLAGGVLGLITMVILSFYLLIEGNGLMNYASRFLPESQREPMSAAAREAVVKVSAWLRAQLTLAGVMATFAAVGLGLLHVPYFYVIALIAAVGETIPVLGPLIGGVAAVAIALSVSPKLAVTVAIYYGILHQLEANILVPKIMERRVGVSPVGVMVALLIGGSVFGIVGAILAVPTAAILTVLVEQFGPSAISPVVVTRFGEPGPPPS